MAYLTTKPPKNSYNIPLDIVCILVVRCATISLGADAFCGECWLTTVGAGNAEKSIDTNHARNNLAQFCYNRSGGTG